MKALIVLLALLCCVLVLGLTQTGSLPSISGGTSGTTTAAETASPPFAAVEVDDMILARYCSDIPGFETSYETFPVGEKPYDSDEVLFDEVPVVLGSVTNGSKTAIGYTFSGLTVGQIYLIDYHIVDLAESFGLTKYHFRQGVSGGFADLPMPDLTTGCVFFTAEKTSVDFILMIIENPSQENLSSYARFIEESTLFGIAEVKDR